MQLKTKRVLQTMAGAVMCMALVAGAQTAAPAPAAPPVWSVGQLDFSGLFDGYYSYNANRPSVVADGAINQDYNFNDLADTFNIAEARLTLNHTADPVGVHVDVVFGRVNTDINPATTTTSSQTSSSQYLEQAYVSWTPAKTHGTELDFGKFVSSAGAEVIESMSNWNYSRSILFVDAIPYWHMGLRTSTPLTKIWTGGIQVVNGWNNDSTFNNGITWAVTSAVVKPNWTWDLNYYNGPATQNVERGKLQLIDSTYEWTPQKGKTLSKLNTYINYDYGQQRCIGGGAPCFGAHGLARWQGIAGAAHFQATGTQAFAGRYEYFDDYQGIRTGYGPKTTLQEFTATYEYKWAAGLLTRIEYRRDWDANNAMDFIKGGRFFGSEHVNAQSTLTIGFVAFFGPHR
jgi:hypothetical protein